MQTARQIPQLVGAAKGAAPGHVQVGQPPGGLAEVLNGPDQHSAAQQCAQPGNEEDQQEQKGQQIPECCRKLPARGDGCCDGEQERPRLVGKGDFRHGAHGFLLCVGCRLAVGLAACPVAHGDGCLVFLAKGLDHRSNFSIGGLREGICELLNPLCDPLTGHHRVAFRQEKQDAPIDHQAA